MRMVGREGKIIFYVGMTMLLLGSFASQRACIGGSFFLFVQVPVVVVMELLAVVMM